MLITDKNKLQKFSAPYRLWQGIPAIEVTKGGRIFSAFYSGGTKEEIGNFCILIRSDDGISFSQPVAATFDKLHRCYDPCLWIDPLDRLWFIWAAAPDHAVYAVICNDPDADELIWSNEIKIGCDVMMNKPTVLSSGEWLFPIAVWSRGVVHPGGLISPIEDSKRLAYAYCTTDKGKSFTRLGGASVPQRSYDEHMLLELEDGSLAMFVRTFYGIGVSYSYDGGKSWTEGEDSGLGGPCSRFFITRLRSGRVLLINHYKYTGRSHLTALLSEDDGRSWKYSLLLDERTGIAYPDAKEADDGYIYITYDRERGAFLDSLDKVYSSAREVLFARVTEDDIINGSLVNDGSFLKHVISKLDKYANEDEVSFK